MTHWEKLKENRRFDLWGVWSFADGDYFRNAQGRLLDTLDTSVELRKRMRERRVPMDFDFTEFKDTTQGFEDPAKWIAECTAQYVNMILLALPPEFRLEIRGERDRELVVKKVLEGLVDTLELINEGKMEHKSKEYVTNFYDWVREAILDFLYGGALRTDRWTKSELKEARVRAMKLLAEDV